MIYRTIAFLLIVFSVTINEAQASTFKKLPQWLKEAQKLPAPPQETGKKKNGIITIWDEGIYEISSNGKITRTYRYAIKVIDNKGSNLAKAKVRYERKSDNILNFKAWTIDSEQEVYTYKGKDKTDTGQIRGSIYQESRVRSIDGSDRTHNGDVFAYEYTTERNTIFTQHRWFFHSNNPVSLSRLTINYPQGWTLRENIINEAPIRLHNGNKITWEMHHLETKKNESRAPYTSYKGSHILIDVVPPKESKTNLETVDFDSWKSIANYKAKVMDPMAEPNEEITAKTTEIVKEEHTDWEKIQAIGNYAKRLTYAGIWMNIAEGGGYTPRTATETFRTGYGDCKDKTALFRAMLKSVGINSYSISVNALDNGKVMKGIPSTGYFNHCIAAVEVDETVNTPAVLEDDKLGRLLYVDVTSEITPIGELPYQEQGGWILIGEQNQDKVSRLPEASGHENRVESRIEAELRPDGSLVARLSSSHHGKSANEERRILKFDGENEYKKNWKKRLVHDKPGIKLEIESFEDFENTTRNFNIQIAFGYPLYAKKIGGELLVLNPTMIDRIQKNPFTKEERTQPIQFRPQMLDLELRLYIPAGFKVDESINTIELDSEFASYRASIDIEDGIIIYKRAFVEKSAIIPAADYNEVQSFYSDLIKAESSPIILAKID